MHISGKNIILVYSTIVILWWVCIWGLFEEVIHHVSNKNPLNKVIIYVSVICIIIGITYHIPETLEQF